MGRVRFLSRAVDPRQGPALREALDAAVPVRPAWLPVDKGALWRSPAPVPAPAAAGTHANGSRVNGSAVNGSAVANGAAPNGTAAGAAAADGAPPADVSARRAAMLAELGMGTRDLFGWTVRALDLWHNPELAEILAPHVERVTVAVEAGLQRVDDRGKRRRLATLLDRLATASPAQTRWKVTTSRRLGRGVRRRS
jgi:hypothetical protein